MEVNDSSGTDSLIEAARRGDEDAQGRLFDAYRAYLRLLARVEVGRGLQAKIDASDIVQETFLTAHRSFGGFRGTTRGELVQWLRRILATRLSNAVRFYTHAQRRDVNLEQRLDQSMGDSSRQMHEVLGAVQESPSQYAGRREEAVMLADAIARLPDDYHEVIVLHHLEGLTFPDVARAMGRSVGAVEKLWTRA
ncbi:MAG: sigma-70 family RNA polymerase sigma factor, partial [Planctomycetota bacterium]